MPEKRIRIPIDQEVKKGQSFFDSNGVIWFYDKIYWYQGKKIAVVSSWDRVQVTTPKNSQGRGEQAALNIVFEECRKEDFDSSPAFLLNEPKGRSI